MLTKNTNSTKSEGSLLPFLLLTFYYLLIQCNKIGAFAIKTSQIVQLKYVNWNFRDFSSLMFYISDFYLIECMNGAMTC